MPFVQRRIVGQDDEMFKKLEFKLKSVTLHQEENEKSINNIINRNNDIISNNLTNSNGVICKLGGPNGVNVNDNRSAVDLCKLDGVKNFTPPPTLHHSTAALQLSFLILIRQIVDLAKHSESIIMQIFQDSMHVNERWQKLEQRLTKIKLTAERLMSLDPAEIASTSDINRFITVKNHYSSTKNDVKVCETGIFSTISRQNLPHLSEFKKKNVEKQHLLHQHHQKQQNFTTRKKQVQEKSSQTDPLMSNRLNTVCQNATDDISKTSNDILNPSNDISKSSNDISEGETAPNLEMGSETSCTCSCATCDCNGTDLIVPTVYQQKCINDILKSPNDISKSSNDITTSSNDISTLNNEEIRSENLSNSSFASVNKRNNKLNPSKKCFTSSINTGNVKRPVLEDECTQTGAIGDDLSPKNSENSPKNVKTIVHCYDSVNGRPLEPEKTGYPKKNGRATNNNEDTTDNSITVDYEQSDSKSVITIVESSSMANNNVKSTKIMEDSNNGKTLKGEIIAVKIDPTKRRMPKIGEKFENSGEFLRQSANSCKNSTNFERISSNFDEKSIKSHQNRRNRQNRRNTIAIFDKLGRSPNSEKKIDNFPTTLDYRSDTVIGGDYGSVGMADEYFYDFAPFYRRRQKRSIFSNVNQFFSLRRPTKKRADENLHINNTSKNEKIDQMATSSGNVAEKIDKSFSSSRKSISCEKSIIPESSNNKGSAKSGSSIAKFFKRTLSLRLPSKKQDQAAVVTSGQKKISDCDYLYDNLPLRRPNVITSAPAVEPIGRRSDSNKIHVYEKSVSRDRNFTAKHGGGGCPKSANCQNRNGAYIMLPISTDSRVISVAADIRHEGQKVTSNRSTAPILRNPPHAKAPSPSSSRDSAYSSCGNKKVRPASVASFGSVTSLDLNDKHAHTGWYRQGYRLEYPDECLIAAPPAGANKQNVHYSPDYDNRRPVLISPPRLISSTVPSDLFSPNGSSRRCTDSPEPCVKYANLPGNDCVNYANLPGRHVNYANLPPPITHNNQGRPHPSSGSSPLSVDDQLSVVDSNYSCDQEGYFTSMHRDSGLPLIKMTSSPARAGVRKSMKSTTAPSADQSYYTLTGCEEKIDNSQTILTNHVAIPTNHVTPTQNFGGKMTTCSGVPFRGRSFSTHSSCSTVTTTTNQQQAPPKNVPPPEYEDYEEYANESCDCGDFSGSDYNRRHSAASHHNRLVAETIPNRRQQKSNAPDVLGDAFDKWLLTKFQTEMMLKQNNNVAEKPVKNGLNRKLPVPDRINRFSNGSADGRGWNEEENYLRNAQTMPARKSVRFSDS